MVFGQILFEGVLHIAAMKVHCMHADLTTSTWDPDDDGACRGYTRNWLSLMLALLA